MPVTAESVLASQTTIQTTIALRPSLPAGLA